MQKTKAALAEIDSLNDALGAVETQGELDAWYAAMRDARGVLAEAFAAETADVNTRDQIMPLVTHPKLVEWAREVAS